MEAVVQLNKIVCCNMHKQKNWHSNRQIICKGSDLWTLRKNSLKNNKKISEDIAEAKTSGPAEKKIDLPVSPFRKVLGIIMAVVTVVMTLGAIILIFCPNPFEGKDMAYGEIIIGGFLLAFIMAYLTAFCLFPGKVWSAELYFSSYLYSQNPIPSDLALNMQCVAFIFFTLMAIGFIVLEVWIIFKAFTGV